MRRRDLIGFLLLVAGATGPLSATEGAHEARGSFHLYLLAGQSNMAGRGAVAEQDKTVHRRVLTLNCDNQWVPAREPLHFDKPAYVGVGPGLAFGKALAEADTNATIGLIPCAAGGSPISAWKRKGYHSQTQSHPYDDAVKRCRIAMRRGVLKGVLWHQGESDSNPEDGPLYAQRLADLIFRLRQDLQSPNLLFVAGTPADAFIARKPEAALVIDGIETVAKADENVYRVSARHLECKTDRVHFNADAARELGRRYAEAVLKRKNVSPASGSASAADNDSRQ